MLRRTAALLATLVLAVAACGDDEGPGEVVVMGDSVTEQSADEIRAALGDDVAVHAIAGIRTDELLPVAQEVLAAGVEEPPRVAVVMAGYNDLWQGREDQATVDELIAAMAGIDCAIWVLVPTVGPWERDRARAFDARVQAAAEQAGVAVETAWRDAVDGDDGSEPLVVPDEVHPSDAGRRRLAEVMAAAVDREC